MTKTLLRVAAFAAITLCLTWLWDEGGRMAYGRFLKSVAPPIYDLIGFEGARVGAFRQRYVNFIPFVGLVLVTPHLSARRRAIGLALGLFALFCGHLALNLTEIGAGARAASPARALPRLGYPALPLLARGGRAGPGSLATGRARRVRSRSARRPPGDRDREILDARRLSEVEHRDDVFVGRRPIRPQLDRPLGGLRLDEHAAQRPQRRRLASTEIPPEASIATTSPCCCWGRPDSADGSESSRD
jgi:hypothetical protein